MTVTHPSFTCWKMKHWSFAGSQCDKAMGALPQLPATCSTSLQKHPHLSCSAPTLSPAGAQWSPGERSCQLAPTFLPVGLQEKDASAFRFLFLWVCNSLGHRWKFMYGWDWFFLHLLFLFFLRHIWNIRSQLPHFCQRHLQWANEIVTSQETELKPEPGNWKNHWKLTLCFMLTLILNNCLTNVCKKNLFSWKPMQFSDED